MLRYDFDVFVSQGSGKVRPRLIVKLRDERAVEALRQADPVVQRYMATCGFVMEASQSGMPAGRFMAEDRPARDAVVKRMAAQMRMLKAGSRYWGGFDPMVFMQSYQQARAVEAAVVVPAGVAARRKAGAGLWELGAFAGALGFAAFVVFAT